jgi:hypothetical protein
MPDLLDDILAERAAAPAPTRDLLDDIMDERNASPPAASTSVSPANAPEVAATAPPPRRPGRVGGASPSAIAGRAEGAQPVSRAAVRQGFLNTLEQEGWLGSFTTAASGAVDKGLYRNEQGQWNPPIMAQVSPEPTLTDRAGQIAAALAQKTGGRLDQAGSGINAEGLRGTLDRFQQQTGMSDEGVKEVWQDAVALYRPWGADEHVRTLSDGALVPNPQDSTWLDPQKAGEMIGNLDATPEAKAQLMAKLPQLAEALSNAKLEGYEAAASAVNQASAAGSLGSLGLTRLAAGRMESPSEWAERTGRTGAGFGGPEFIRDYEREVIDPVSGPRKFIRGLTGKGLTGWNKLATTVLGVVGGVSDASAQLAAAGAEAGGVINQGLPDTGLAGSAMEEAPSLLAQYFSGQALGAVAGAVMGAGRAAQATTAAGIYLTAGAQSYGMQIADDLAEGKPIEKARENAMRAGISATITSAALGAGALGGVEAAAAGNIGSATIRDLLNAAQAQGVRNIYKQPELRKFVQETVLAGVGERLQEQTDQFLQEFLTADPDTSLADAWDNSVKAGNVATILGAGAHVMGGAMVDTAADMALDAQVDAPDVAKVAADEVAAARRVAAAATTETLTDTDTPEGDVQGDFGITRQTDDRDTEMGTEGGPSLPQSQPVAVQSQVGGTETGASAGDVGADDRATQRGTAGLASEPLESSGEPLIFGRTWEQIQRMQQGDRPPALGPVDALRHAQKIVEDVRRFQIPVDASVVSRYELTLPNGYVREGDLYVYRPEQSSTPAPPDVAPPSQQGQGQVPAEAGGGTTGLAPVQPHETGVGAGVETRDDFIQRKLDEFRNTPRWEMMPPEYRRRAEEDARRKAENEWLDLQEQRYIAGQPVEEPPAWAETAQQRAERSGDTLDSYIEESHARIVGDALAAGKPVPDNVRREHEVYTLEQEEEWARLTLDSSEKYYVESAVGDVRRAYERKKDATAALPSDETHEVVKRSTNPNRWVVIEKFDAAQARARDILARLKQLRETSPAQQLAIFQSPTTPQTNEDEGQRQGQGQGLQVAPATEPAAAAAPDEGAAAGPVFTRDEIVVGQVRSGTKRREAGTDGDRWAEVRAPGKVLEPENWSRVDDSKLSAFVQAYYDFASRKAPKKTERSWIVRAGTRAVPKDVLARGLTFAEAVERAKDHVESANPPTNEATTQDQVAEAGSPAALEGQPTQPAPAGEAEAGAAQRGGEGAQGAEVVGREVPHAGTIAESLPAIREALPGYTPVFRIGDFHEFFGDDADLTGTAVTKRGGLRMSGVPPHQLSALQDIANRTGRPLAVITGNSVSEVVQPEPPVSPAGETAAVGEQQVAESATSLAGSTISEQGAPVRAAGEQMVTAASELQPGEVIQVGKTKHRVKSVTPLGDGRVEVDATGLFGADRVMRGDARVALVPQEPSPLQSAADQLAENAAEGRAEERRKLHLTPQNPFEPAALRNDIRAADLRSEDPAVEARWKGARLAKSKLITRLRNAITSVRQAFTRHFSKLDSVTDAVQIDILRQQEAVPQAARAEAVAILHGITSKLGPNKYDLFSRVVILPDIVRSIDQGLYDGKELPFGYADRAAVERDLVKFRDIASRYPDVMEALDARKRFMNALRDELVSRDLLPESVKDFDEYFHRQVIEMMNAREAFGTGTSSQDVRLHTKGFQKRRKGSSKDFNTNYIESEFEVISQAFAQIMTQDTLKRIKQTSDIRPALEQTAKQENLYALYGGEETYREALSIRAQIKELQSSPDSKESYVREQLAGLHERLNEIDPLVPHRLAKAIAKSRMSKTAAEDGYAGAPERFSDVVDRLADEHNNRGRSGEEAEFFGEDPPDTDFWGFVAWAADQGDFGALGLFKAIADERAFIKETLGDRFLTWRKLMSADYTTWQPKPGTQMYWANTVTERALEAYLQGSRELTESDFKKVLASAGPRQQWVIPKRLADTLDDFRPVRENFIEKFAGAGVSAWKVWTLLNPFRVVKYNVNNTSGDVDIVMAYDPAILKRVPKAARDAFQFQVRKTPASAEIKSLIDKGVMNSSFSVAEVPDIGGLEIFDALLGRKPNLIKRYWRTTKDYTTWREDILRLASSRHFLDKIRSGERPLGASKKVEMDQLYAARDAGTVTNEDIAAKLARELVGDYGNISVAGQWLRQHMIPFYSWMEINAPRYVRLMKNAKHEGTSGSPAAVATWAAAKKTSAFALKASIIYGLVSLWNRLFFPDEEKELGDQRGQLHLIIGRMPDGSVLSLRFQGALSDALSWFGAENLPADAAAMADGDKSLKDQAVEMLMATPNKIVNAASPIYKTTIEAMAGFSLYPDPTNPRPIRDRVRRMADLMSMGRIYDYLSDKPTRGVGHDILSTVFYTTDVGEASYFRIKSLVYDYNTKQGKDRPAALSTDKGDALFYYKQSLKFGDAQKAERWKQRYFEMGGTDAGIGQSIRASAPLAGVAMKDRKDFMETLSDEDRAMLLRAEQWYQKTYRSDNQ